MPEHTPGPWRVEGDHVVTTDHLAQQLIAWPTEGPYALPYDQRRANAALIAAAPELLAAAQFALQVLAQSQETDALQAHRLIEDAVAEAVGGNALA